MQGCAQTAKFTCISLYSSSTHIALGVVPITLSWQKRKRRTRGRKEGALHPQVQAKPQIVRSPLIIPIIKVPPQQSQASRHMQRPQHPVQSQAVVATQLPQQHNRGRYHNPPHPMQHPNRPLPNMQTLESLLQDLIKAAQPAQPRLLSRQARPLGASETMSTPQRTGITTTTTHIPAATASPRQYGGGCFRRAVMDGIGRWLLRL